MEKILIGMLISVLFFAVGAIGYSAGLDSVYVSCNNYGKWVRGPLIMECRVWK